MFRDMLSSLARLAAPSLAPWSTLMVASTPSWQLPLACLRAPLSRTSLGLHMVSHHASIDAQHKAQCTCACVQTRSGQFLTVTSSMPLLPTSDLSDAVHICSMSVGPACLTKAQDSQAALSCQHNHHKHLQVLTHTHHQVLTHTNIIKY